MSVEPRARIDPAENVQPPAYSAVPEPLRAGSERRNLAREGTAQKAIIRRTIRLSGPFFPAGASGIRAAVQDHPLTAAVVHRERR